jgi:hypothetical protein
MYGYAILLPLGAKGSLMTLARPALPPTGSAHGRMAHVLDLDQQVQAGPSVSLWKRFTNNLNPSLVPAYGGAVYDAKRNRAWGTQSTGTDSTMYWLDIATGTWGKTSMVQGAFYGTLMRSEAHDRMVYMRQYAPSTTVDFNTGVMVQVIDPDLGKVTRISNISGRCTGTTPPYDSAGSPIGGGADWCDDLPGGPGFVYYPGGGKNVVYICQPLGDFDTGVWNWTAQMLTPVPVQAGQVPNTPQVQFSPAQAAHMRRFIYVPSIRCFLWFAGNGAPANAWRLFA